MLYFPGLALLCLDLDHTDHRLTAIRGVYCNTDTSLWLFDLHHESHEKSSNYSKDKSCLYVFQGAIILNPPIPAPR